MYQKSGEKGFQMIMGYFAPASKTTIQIIPLIFTTLDGILYLHDTFAVVKMQSFSVSFR